MDVGSIRMFSDSKVHLGDTSRQKKTGMSTGFLNTANALPCVKCIYFLWCPDRNRVEQAKIDD